MNRAPKLIFLAIALSCAGFGCMPSAAPPTLPNTAIPAPAPGVAKPPVSPPAAPPAPETDSNLVAVESPKPDETVRSPLVVTGVAPGRWYFEASFPVQLLDVNGNVLAAVPAQAQSDWMTDKPVPFKATLIFNAPHLSDMSAQLVLKKDNPSGLPENEDEFRIPVRLDAGASPQ